MAGPLPLRWTAVDRWAERNGIEGEAFEFLWAMLRELDLEFLDWNLKKQADGNSSGEP